MDARRRRSAVALVMFLARLHVERRAGRRRGIVGGPLARHAILAATAALAAFGLFAGGLLAGALL